MEQTQSGCSSEHSRKFDFMIGDWTVQNRVKRDGEWKEFEAHNHGEPYLGGCAIIDTYDARLPNGNILKGITIRSYDKFADHWNIVWLDNRNKPDLTALIGKFKEDGTGEFNQSITNEDGTVTHIRFIWDNITEKTARWRQFFSQDGGQTWDMNWVMEFSR